MQYGHNILAVSISGCDPNRTLNGPSLYHLAGQGDQHSDLMSGEALDWSQTAEIAALFAGL